MERALKSKYVFYSAKTQKNYYIAESTGQQLLHVILYF